ncbi:MAG: lysophospholipid acyltransferase family protein [Chloroflexota bacterium]
MDRKTTLLIENGAAYPERRVLRRVMQWLSLRAFSVLSRLEIEGAENIPARGPLIVVANHFSFLDPALMVGIVPWPLEFLGGFHQPNAPASVKFIPKLWGYLPVFRGTAARNSLLLAERVLAQGGVLGIYPEATSDVAFLRPARPGTAFLAARTGAPILPIGFSGLTELFPHLRRGRRAHVVARIGRPFGPFAITARGQARRQALDELGHEIMRHIAELIPPELRGYYSEDPAIRAAAQSLNHYQYDIEPETA